MLGKREETLLHRHLAIVQQRLEERRIVVQPLYLRPSPLLVQLLQSPADTIITGDILLQLAPGTYERDRPQILQLQPPRSLASRRPARNIGLVIKTQRTHLI